VGLEQSLPRLGVGKLFFGWIKSNEMAIYCVVFAADVAKPPGFVMAMFLAVLRGVDNEQVNAARVDGAKTWQIYLRIIIPQRAGVRFRLLILAHMAIKSYDLVVAF